MNKSIFAETSATLSRELDQVKQHDAVEIKMQQEHIEGLEAELAVSEPVDMHINPALLTVAYGTGRQ